MVRQHHLPPSTPLQSCLMGRYSILKMDFIHLHVPRPLKKARVEPSDKEEAVQGHVQDLPQKTNPQVPDLPPYVLDLPHHVPDLPPYVSDPPTSPHQNTYPDTVTKTSNVPTQVTRPKADQQWRATVHPSPPVAQLAPPSREEFNSYRLNQLEATMLQAQRTSLIESKISRSGCFFQLDLPPISSYEQYRQLPLGACLPEQAQMVQPGNFNLVKPQAEEDEAGEEVCFCGLQPVQNTIKAPGSDNGRTFLSCIRKNEDDQCSYFKWVKVLPQKVIIFN